MLEACEIMLNVSGFRHCSMIVDKKENKLRKGSGFHLDILVLGFAALINGIIGMFTVLGIYV